MSSHTHVTSASHRQPLTARIGHGRTHRRVGRFPAADYSRLPLRSCAPHAPASELRFSVVSIVGWSPQACFCINPVRCGLAHATPSPGLAGAERGTAGTPESRPPPRSAASAVPSDPPLRVAARVPRAAARCTRTRTRCAELVGSAAPCRVSGDRVRGAPVPLPCRARRRGAMDDGGGRRLARCLPRLAHVSGADMNRTIEFFGSKKLYRK